MEMNRWKLKTWKINPSKLQNWKRLDPNFPKEKATDCAVNTFSYLGVFDNLQSDEEVKLKAHLLNITGKGTTIPEKVGTIYDKLHLITREKYDVKCVLDLIVYNPKDKYIWERRLEKSKLSSYCKYKSGFLNDIDYIMKNGEFTLFDFYRYDGTGHSVVLGKVNDSLYIIDPQQETINKEQEKMDIDNNNNCIDLRSISSLFEDYLIREKARVASFILVKETIGKRSAKGSLPINVRRSKTPEPPLKKRKLSGGKKKNGKKKKTYKKNGKKKLKHTRKYKKKKTIKKHKKKSGKKKH